MAIHLSVQSMRREALREMMRVAEYCVAFRKDPQEWDSSGCYGYPAAILLFAIANAIGSVVIKKRGVRNHFDIFIHPDYYNLPWSKESIDLLTMHYRHALTHHAIMGNPQDSRDLRGYHGLALDIGNPDSQICEDKEGMPCLNLFPFLQLTRKVVDHFLNDEHNQ
jgi:hypothetical protein